MTKNKWLSLFTAAPAGLVWQSTLATASALLWLLAVPPFGVGWLAWIAFVPLLYALCNNVRWTRALWLGWLTGLLFTFFAANWITHPMIHFGGMPAIAAYAVAFLFSAILACFPALFAAIQVTLLNRFGAWTLAFAPMIWAATEFARAFITGITWNAVGITQVKTFVVARLVQYGGVYLLSALVMAGSAILVLFTRLKQPRVRHAVSALLLLSAIAFWLPAFQPPRDSSGVAVNVLGVQPNIPVDIQLGDTSRYLLKTIQMTRSAVAPLQGQARPDLIVWAECPLTLFYENEEDTRTRLNQLAQDTGAFLIINSAGPDDANHYFNSVTTLTPKGEALRRYDKMRLLPFGEYVPWQAVLGRFVPAMVGNFTPGTSATVNTLRLETQRQSVTTDEVQGIERTTSFVRTGAFICYEAAFPEHVRRYVQQGATLLVNLSEDGWFGTTAENEQHLLHTLMRAIETDRDVVRVTNTGISALLTADGQVVEAMPSAIEATQRWQAHTRSGQTFYVRHGEWFAWVCLAVSLLGLVMSVFRKN
ncbi:MAG: apolipoprotein N-acyltransferase [Acidobacteria bacterium]|nr:apolipoprotein N-acyltransferase [Acidobacteriota bacterium]